MSSISVNNVLYFAAFRSNISKYVIIFGAIVNETGFLMSLRWFIVNEEKIKLIVHVDFVSHKLTEFIY